MKQLLQAVKPVCSLFVFAGVLLLSYPSQLAAQMAWPAVGSSLPDNGYAASFCTTNERLNIDLYNYKPGFTPEQLLAFVYDGGSPGAPGNLVVFDRKTGIAKQQALAGTASKPDVVIGDDPSSTGDLLVSVVYEDAGNVYYDAYQVSGMGTTGLSCNQVPGYPVQLNTASPAQEIHIDMAPTPGGTPVYGTLPPLHNFVIAWAEWNGGNYDIVAFGGNLGTLPTASPATQLIDKGDRVDVALNSNTGSWAQTAYFIYYTPMGATGDVMYADWDLIFPPNTYPPVDPTVGVNGCPRIDAANLTTNSILATDVNWQAVAEINNSLLEIHAYDNTGGTVSMTNYSTLSFTNNPLISNNGRSPAVACGNGQATSGTVTDIGNTTYTMGWHINAPVGSENFYAVSVDITGAGPTGYSQVPFASPVNNFTNSIAPAFAVANGSNDGFELATAWYNWTAVYWKFSGNTFMFKTTGLEGTFNLYKPFIYPNPANNYLVVENLENAGYYITSITGTVLQKGTINTKNHHININNLPNGLYLINLTTPDKIYNLKFVKQ